MTPRRRTLLLLSLLLAACTTAPPPAPPAEFPLQWPAAPEPARIAFVQTISRAEDLGIRKNWLQRIGAWVFGADDLRLVRPMAVIEVDGILYVADPGMQGVHRLDRAGGSHRLLRQANGQPLPSPIGLAADRGRVYVVDSSLRKVFVVDKDAEAVVELSLQVELIQPTGIATDPKNGQLIIVDTGAHRILRLARDGALAGSIGQRGRGDGEFNFPTMVWRDKGGRLIVSDTLNFRVQIFGDEGQYLSKFGRAGDAGGDLSRHKGVASDSLGHIYVVDSLQHALQVFDANGRLLIGVGGRGRDNGEFWLPTGIFITPDNTIYVADAYNRRIQVFQYVGADL